MLNLLARLPAYVALVAVVIPTSIVDAQPADGCKQCISEHAGNCYHASWPGKAADKCSKEKSEAKCEGNDNGVWCSGGPTPSPTPGQPKNITLHEITFYGFPDNCPPSAQPHSLGTGTYESPITFAGAPSAIPSGTLLYIGHFRKYFIMDDECEECEHDWKKRQVYHTDLWLGPDHMSSNYTRLVGCEDAMSDEQQRSAMLNPPKGLPVDTTPFYDASTDTCMVPCKPCHETCNPKVECNECDGISGSCEKVAGMFSLTIECFQKLNPHIDCSKGLKGGTFCQGSGCPLGGNSSFPPAPWFR
jgi:hypothetical protein